MTAHTTLRTSGGALRWLAGASPLVLTALLVCAPQAALAQATNTGPTQSSRVTEGVKSDATSVEEVVVTARKREERLRDIPTSGIALGADAIRELGGVPSAQSLLSNTPGVNFANTSNPVTSEVSIRGSGTSRATNAESGVGLFRDGAYIGGGTVAGRTFADLDLFDAGRIEVLRGVQGGLNGRNAEGGSVNVISARPTHKYEGFILGTAANNERGGVQAVVNLPIDDHWAFRGGLELMNQAKGFYHLPYVGDGSQYADNQSKSFFRGQVNYTAGIFTANLLVEHGSQQLPGLVYQITGFPSATYPTGYQQDRFNMPWNSPSEAKLTLNNYELTTATTLPFGSLQTVSTYRERYGQNAYDRDASSPQFIETLIAAGKVNPASYTALRNSDTTLGGNQLDKARIFYQDAHITGDRIGNFSWVAGGDYYLLRDRPSSILGKSYTVASPSIGTIDKAQVRFQSYAFYGSGQYDFSPQFNLSADLRVTKDDEDYSTRRLDYGSGAPGAAAFAIDGVKDSTNVSYTVSGSYKPRPGLLFYTKIGTAFRPGNFNTSLGDPRQPITPPISFDDETVQAYEVGFKGNLLPNIYMTAAIYQNDFDNLVIQGDNGCAVGNPVCPVQATSFAFNAGPASLYGFETEVTARFNVFGGPLRITAGGARQGGKVTGGIYKGRRQPQQPDWTTTFNINYRHALAHEATGFFNLKGNGRWGGVQEVAQTPPLYDYVLVDSRAGIEWKRYELSVYAENLFDEKYIVFNAITATNTTTRYNIPRNFGVQLRYTW